MAAFGGELHGIGKQIEDDLVDPEFVHQRISLLKAGDFAGERDALFIAKGSDNRGDIAFEFFGGIDFGMEFDFIAFDFAKIEDVVDEPEQELTGSIDLFKVVGGGRGVILLLS